MDFDVRLLLESGQRLKMKAISGMLSLIRCGEKFVATLCIDSHFCFFGESNRNILFSCLEVDSGHWHRLSSQKCRCCLELGREVLGRTVSRI